MPASHLPTWCARRPGLQKGRARRSGLQFSQNETDDEFIHIVMPLDQVNLLNPGNELSRRASGSKWSKLSDSLLQIGGETAFDDG